MLIPLLLPPVLVAEPAPAPGQDRAVLAMGTELRLRLEGQGATLGSEAALAECARIEAACSTWNPQSAWSRLNGARGEAVPLPGEWIHLLGRMVAWSRRTQGAFDPTLMALMQAWKVREGGKTPMPEALARARQATGSGLLELDPVRGTARLRDAQAGLEEGGFLKGYALDAMRAASAAPAGWMDFGGQILAWGKPLLVSIADPRDRHRSRVNLELRNASLACSGTSERGRHILDPRSGRPCEAWGATAVVAQDALTADVLSTALYVMGPDAGLAWADRHGVAGAFLLNNGSIRLSSAFRTLHPSSLKEHP